MSVTDRLSDDNPLNTLYDQCVDAGVDMKLMRPEGFAEAMIAYALELVGEPE